MNQQYVTPRKINMRSVEVLKPVIHPLQKFLVSHHNSFPKQTEMALCVGLDDEDGSCHGTIQEGAYDKEIKDHWLLQQVLCSPFQHTFCHQSLQLPARNTDIILITPTQIYLCSLIINLHIIIFCVPWFPQPHFSHEVLLSHIEVACAWALFNCKVLLYFK